MDLTFELLEKNTIPAILPLLHELDPTIPEHLLQSRLAEMVARGYECVGIYCDNDLIGMCGFWTLVKYYAGRHIEPDNVYVKAAYRNQGVGKALNAWLNAFALSRGCEAVELNCYIKNTVGRAFWEANEFVPIGIHYQKKLVGGD